MELKTYQSQVIDNLDSFLEVLKKTPHLAKAFKAYWDDRGVTGMDAYKNNVPGVPHVCVKVPTAGGKTYIAVNALKTIFDAFTANNPDRAQFVVWLVPSITILDQTVKALSNPEHPYRQRLSQCFKGRVQIYEKRDLLMGAGFSYDAVRGQLSIVVMSFDSLRSKKKEDRKIFQENGYLASFLTGTEQQESDWLLPDHDPTALINVIRRLKPVVVVDESHNAETPLSVEMLANLNPDFILDLTATPKNNSNIISYVDAMALKRHHMVKLPVIVANQPSKTDVINSAIIMRRQLEAIAIAEEKQGGKYIRPIVLFQAQPRVGDDATTYDKLKKSLVDVGIPIDQIKIKTAEINELKNIDLLHRDCAVRFIITVNALKEGWDCPFAYVLASLADKSSAVDVEQILGRVLRMPYVQQHGHDLLNLSYVFTASNKFMDTIQSVVKALNRAGFSDKDYRTVDVPAPPIEPTLPTPGPAQATLELVQPVVALSDEDGQADETDWEVVAATISNVNAQGTTSAITFVEQVKVQAAEENQAFEKKAEASTDSDVPPELREKMNTHKLNEVFAVQALEIRMPQFFINVANEGWFEQESAQQLFERDELLKTFKLSHADSNISFDDIDGEMYRVDLERLGDQNYAPKPFKINSKDREKYNAVILAQSPEGQILSLSDRIAKLIGNLYPITDPEVKKYVRRVLENMTTEQLRDCLERDLAYVEKIKAKIKALSNVHAYKTFVDLLDVEKIVIGPGFAFPPSISPSQNAPAFPKSLYSTEASMGGFEARLIDKMANLENVVWWHRNLSRNKGFRLNGFLNHYPDFILKTKSGKLLIVETKGDDRDNSDSELKLKLGKLWEARAGSNYRYLMVFESNSVAGAEVLSDALIKIAQF
jgi:type III restriction enzyme